MKIKSFAVMLAFVTAMSGSFQTVYGESSNYKPIQIPIPPPPAHQSRHPHGHTLPAPPPHIYKKALPTPQMLEKYKPIPIAIPSNRSGENFDLKPQPGYDVTLMLNHKVHFAWSGKHKKFIIKDEHGKKIFEQKIDDKNEIDIIPSKIKLKAGTKYVWNMDGVTKNYKFTILDTQTEQEIMKNLSEIDAENLTFEECTIKKATYLLMLSDEYSDVLDFYWLIAQSLSQISPTDKNLEEKKSDLLQRCVTHFNEEMF